MAQKQMTSRESYELNLAILIACEETQAISGILQHPRVAPLVKAHGTRKVKDRIRLLAVAGLIFSAGETRALYKTTQAGRASIESLNKSLRPPSNQSHM